MFSQAKERWKLCVEVLPTEVDLEPEGHNSPRRSLIGASTCTILREGGSSVYSMVPATRFLICDFNLSGLVVKILQCYTVMWQYSPQPHPNCISQRNGSPQADVWSTSDSSTTPSSFLGVIMLRDSWYFFLYYCLFISLRFEADSLPCF